MATRYSEIGEALLPLINPVAVRQSGWTIADLRRRERRRSAGGGAGPIDKRFEHSAAGGNLNDYVNTRWPGMATPGGGGAGGFATEMAVGMAMAQQLIQATGRPDLRDRLLLQPAPQRHLRFRDGHPLHPLRHPQRLPCRSCLARRGRRTASGSAKATSCETLEAGDLDEGRRDRLDVADHAGGDRPARRLIALTGVPSCSPPTDPAERVAAPKAACPVLRGDGRVGTPQQAVVCPGICGAAACANDRPWCRRSGGTISSRALRNGPDETIAGW